jgi:hypothetical protein
MRIAPGLCHARPPWADGRSATIDRRWGWSIVRPVGKSVRQPAIHQPGTQPAPRAVVHMGSHWSGPRAPPAPRRDAGTKGVPSGHANVDASTPVPHPTRSVDEDRPASNRPGRPRRPLRRPTSTAPRRRGTVSTSRPARTTPPSRDESRPIRARKTSTPRAQTPTPLEAWTRTAQLAPRVPHNSAPPGANRAGPASRDAARPRQTDRQTTRPPDRETAHPGPAEIALVWKRQSAGAITPPLGSLW